MKFNKKIRFFDKLISPESPTFIIAEAGVNHNGNKDLAFKLIDIAAESGADAVKFQAFRTNHLINEDVKKASYQSVTTSSSESQAEMLKKLELSFETYVELKNYCQKKKIIFLITPFDEVSLQELEKLNVDAYKVASTDLTNLPFLKKIAKTKKPIILSTGMSYLSEVEAALVEINKFNQDLILLQCTSNYPVPDIEVNLSVLQTYQNKFDVLTGFSDHTVGIGAGPFSIPLGAKVIEKHFTLSKQMEGPDHRASLDPEELKTFIQIVRQVEKYIGQPEKLPTAGEKETRQSLQKCLVASQPISKGEVFSEENLVGKRTGGIGISPMEILKLVGKKASRSYALSEIIDEK